jgi:hypothetical protein
MAPVGSRYVRQLFGEVDEARLIGVEGKSMPCETLAQYRQHTLDAISASSANRTRVHPKNHNL